MKAGVLALQGDFREHGRALADAGASPVEVRNADDLAGVECLVIPGGESTTMGKLARAYDLVEPVRERVARGMPMLGTCAGMIVMAPRVVGGDPLFAVMDIGVERNAYGRQVESFEADVDVDGLDHPVRGVFIRAPRIVRRGRRRARARGARGRARRARTGQPARIILPSGADRRDGAAPLPAREALTPGGIEMSGHSKWATIKRKKAANDAKRSNQYAKLLRAVEVAAREGGSGDVAANMTLASAVEKAKSFSVPTENIERAIKRGTGDDDSGARYDEISYEGYAAGGIALYVEALTDNRNRTAQDVRHAFTRNGGNLGETGSTAWMFTRKGVVVVEKDRAPEEERVLELALDGGAEDLRDSESSWDIISDPAAFETVRDSLEAAGVEVFSAEISMVPQSTIPVDGGEARQVLNLIESLEDLDDVQNVYANFDIPEEVMASL